MGKTATEVRNEIEQARSELGGTLDAIGDRVSPKRIAQRRIGRTRARLVDLRDRVMGTSESAIDEAGSGLSQTGHKLAETAGSVQAQAGEKLQSAVEMGKETPHMIERRTQGNPLAVGLIAFGIGAVIASLLPETRMEREQARQIKRKVTEPVKEQLTEAGQNVAQDLKSAAQDTVESLKAEAGTAAEEVKATAQQGVVNLTDEAKGAAQTVGASARSSAEELKEQSGSGHSATDPSGSNPPPSTPNY